MTAEITPAHALAMAFSTQARQWAIAGGAPELSIRVAQQAAFRVSMAVAGGDVCIGLEELAESLENRLDADRLRHALLDSSIVGTPEARAALPLILDADDRLYLHRYFDYEDRLARSLAQRAAASTTDAIGAGMKSLLASLFAANDDATSPDWQKIAAAMALLGKLTIISGGPGTGKTTTVVNLLACLLEQNPDCRIALAAATGKAAARMTEAIRQRAAHLPAKLQARLPSESHTIHRLLGVTPSTGAFRHHAGNLLPIDALVVDEASMLDLALATKLFEAAPNTARIILLGDKDQLAAVESGAVFAELSINPSLGDARRAELAGLCDLPIERIQPPAPLTRGGLRDCVIWLNRNFRFASDSGIGQLAQEINSGAASAAIARLRANADNSLGWIEDSAPGASDALRQHIDSGYAAYLNALRKEGRSLANVFDAFGCFRILCAVREGPRGVESLNRMVSNHFRAALQSPSDPDENSEWYPGRPVMVLRNDYVLKLFNGDIGIALPDASGALMVYFPDPETGYRAIAPLRLPEHESAFAITIHKSQGSEFDAVLVMLPLQHSRVLTRELIYTAITRARECMTIAGAETILDHAIQASTLRRSGLSARISAWSK